jgi:hypothetical protein
MSLYSGKSRLVLFVSEDQITAFRNAGKYLHPIRPDVSEGMKLQ